MPEVRISETELVKSTRDEPGYRPGYIPNFEKINENKENYIGMGSECVVVKMVGQPTKVEAFSYRGLTPERAKNIFYAHRIFSTLFPHNFPHFYAAFGSEDRVNRTGTIRQRLMPRTQLQTVRAKLRLERNQGKKYPIEKSIDATQKMGIDFKIDKDVSNFIVGNDGGEYYVDTIRYTPEPEDREKVLKYMEENGYSEQDKRTVTMSFDRLYVLQAEAEGRNLEQAA